MLREPQPLFAPLELKSVPATEVRIILPGGAVVHIPHDVDSLIYYLTKYQDFRNHGMGGFSCSRRNQGHLFFRATSSELEAEPTDAAQVNRISIEKLYELFVDTAKRCSSRTVLLSDEEIEQNLFEEFDVGVRSFFHDDNLGRLVEAEMIGRKAVPICQEIRNRWIELDEGTWTIQEIKNNADWKCLFSAGDQLLAILNEQL